MGTVCVRDFTIFSMCEPTHAYPVPIPSAPGNSVSVPRLPSHTEAPSAHVSWTRSDAPWVGLALWSVLADPPHDVTGSSPGYHLRWSPWGRNPDQSCALVHSIYDDDPQNDWTPTPGQSWARSPGWSYSDFKTVFSTIRRPIRTSESEWSFMSIWQQLRRTIAESAGAGVKMIPTEYRCRQDSNTVDHNVLKWHRTQNDPTKTITTKVLGRLVQRAATATSRSHPERQMLHNRTWIKS